MLSESALQYKQLSHFIPYQNMNPDRLSQTGSAPSGSSFTQTHAPTPSILVAEGDADTRVLYREWLAGAGCDIVEAPDGRDALVKALMHPPSLVITEIRLPFIDGYSLCEILRRDQATAEVPILVVTAEARPALVDRARKAGADVVLIKPTPMEHILNEMGRLVAASTRRRRPGIATSANAAAQSDDSAFGLARIGRQRRRSRSYSRLTTTTPPASPPVLRCPSCDRVLTYERSEIGGVSHRHLEQWDYYGCPPCGSFQHRQRTRTLRHVSEQR